MSRESFMDKVRMFLGIRPEPPRNDFRNPIWGSDDEDDDDDLYTRQNVDVFTDAMDIHREFSSQMHDMLRTFGTLFGDMKFFFNDDKFDPIPAIGSPPSEPENFNNGNIRDHYLKPGYHSRKYDEQPKEDIDLDGKISSQEISGLLKRKDDGPGSSQIKPFNGNLVPGRSFCQTIITTSVTRPDGTVETKRIVKNGNEVIEETITSTGPDSFRPFSPMVDSTTNTGLIYNNVMSELSSLFRHFY